MKNVQTFCIQEWYIEWNWCKYAGRSYPWVRQTPAWLWEHQLAYPSSNSGEAPCSRQRSIGGHSLSGNTLPPDTYSSSPGLLHTTSSSPLISWQNPYSSFVCWNTTRKTLILYIALPNKANKCIIYDSLATHLSIPIYNDYDNLSTDIYSGSECAQRGNIIYTDNHTFFFF